jgi:YlmC/YmxH family sporulation protein
MDFRAKEVINVCDGKRLGYIGDVDFDFETGMIKSIMVPVSTNFFGIGRGDDLVIPWKNIAKIGVDTILVDLDTSRRKRFEEVG